MYILPFMSILFLMPVPTKLIWNIFNHEAFLHRFTISSDVLQFFVQTKTKVGEGRLVLFNIKGFDVECVRCYLNLNSPRSKKICVICLIEKFLQRLFGHIGKMAWLEKQGYFKTHDVTTCFTNNSNTQIA